MLRMGDARPSLSAEAKVHEIIDRALNVQKPCDSGHEVAEVIGVAMSIDRRGLTVCVVPWREPDQPLPANENTKRKSPAIVGLFDVAGAT
jgi:hypothetical protein